MKKKIFVTAIVTFLSLCSYSQEHITFNGATFGKSVKSFIKGFPQKPNWVVPLIPSGANAGLFKLHDCDIYFNSNKWYCKIYSSTKSNSVFRTISVAQFSDMKNSLMLLVKSLEEKYGGERQEKQEDLGYIVEKNSKTHKEMLALYYYAKNKKGKVIGEIRISAAPTDRNAISGWIELSYTDYNTRDKATKEYNTLIHDAL